MNKKNLLKVFAVIAVFISTGCATTQERPNILWITSEDNSASFVGCYGNDFATTPNIDNLAKEGFLYSRAYANAPVCSPMRNTIITGVYACSAGNQYMRSFNKKSDNLREYPEYLRESGYYCTNNSKCDYNFADKSKWGNVWDICSNTASYKTRKPGQPFFAIFNLLITHESQIHKSIPTSKLRHDPNKVILPPYHPDTKDIRHDWAQYYDKVEDMDAQVGDLLKELDESGEAENTIVIYCSDHGGVLPRSKRFIYETGTHVPFVVRIPKKFKYLFPSQKTNSKVERIVSFVDMAPTFLSIAGIPIPEQMQGHAFLGKEKTAEPEYSYMFRDRMDERFDMCRAVRDKKFRYIRNYMPYRPLGQHLNYLWKAPSMRSWEKEYKAGHCNAIQSAFFEEKPVEEFYDTANDPWEVKNLANDPACKKDLLRMRKACIDWSKKIYDTGFITENELLAEAKDMAPYDFIRSKDVPLDSIIDAASLATLGKIENKAKCVEFLSNKNNNIRYWGATGLLMLKDNARFAIPQLKKALNDVSPSVQLVVAETLYKLGEEKLALKTIIKQLNCGIPGVQCYAFNVVDNLDINDKIIQERAQYIIDHEKYDITRYDIRMARYLVGKWSK